MAKENQPTEEQIRTRAYYLWEADGRPQGRDCEYWHRAQRELSAQPASAAQNSTPKKTTVVAAEPKRKAASRTPAFA